MELTATRTARPLAQSRRLAGRIDGGALGAWTLAFALVAYLALRGGGYDTVVRSEAGVAIWWIVLLGAATGVLPARIRRAGLVTIALLAGFTAWTGLASSWSESAERSVVEFGRVAAYLGVLVLAIALQGKTAARHTLNGVASAVGLVTVLAVLSRLHPQAFPPNDHFEFLGDQSARKLSYPLNYWNGLAAFAALGVPLLLAVAVGARTLAGQAVAAATLPFSALCVSMTISRGGALALAVGVVVFLVLVPRRLHALATLGLAGLASGILLSAIAKRPALDSGVPSPEAMAQGTQVLWLALIACAGVGLVQVALGLTARYVERPPWLDATRRQLALGALAAALVLACAGVAAGLPGKLEYRWHQFTAPVGVVSGAPETTVFSRLQAANGNGRYELWKAALHANATDPLKGIGPGTFELWWARHATTPGFVRDAHTLYFETLGETGIVGFVLLIGMFAWVLGVAVVRALRAPERLRVWLAGATAGLVTFMVSAAVEWVWELAAVALAALVLIAVIVAGRDEDVAPDPPAAPVARVGLGVLAVAALVAVLIPLAGALAIDHSRAAAASGNLTAALKDAREAQRLQPYAATPHLQEALILEQAGQLDQAAAAVRAATVDEPTNWRTWVVLARLDARRGDSLDAMAAFDEARKLNPESSLFG